MMCCRTIISPLRPEIAVAVLTLGQFVNDSGSRWVRDVPEENARVSANFNKDTLELSISPAISTMIHHLQKRRAAGIYFEIACKYAEKVGGRIEQQANVQECIENQEHTRLLADYPTMPMDFSRVCFGFRAAIQGEERSY